MSKRVRWSALRYISCKHLQTQTVAQSATLMFALHRIGWQVTGESVMCECSVTETRAGSPSLQLKQPATQILTALLLQQRRWDRPLGTRTWRTLPQSSVSWYSNLLPSKSQNLQFDQWDERSVSVRSGQIFWTFGGLPSHKVAGTKRQCRSADLADWNARVGIDSALPSSNFNCFSGLFAFGSHALNKASLFVLERTQIPSCTCSLYQIRMFAQVQASGR